MDRSHEAFPEVVDRFLTTLQAQGIEVEYGAVSEWFGDMLIWCRRRTLVITLVREKLLWFIDVDSCGKSVPVPYWRACLDGVKVESMSRGSDDDSPNYVRNLGYFKDDSDWVTSRLSELDESSDSEHIKGCLQQAIRQHNEMRFGWT